MTTVQPQHTMTTIQYNNDDHTTTTYTLNTYKDCEEKSISKMNPSILLGI